MKKIFILLISLSISLSIQAEDGWPQPKNGGYFKIGQWWLVADQHYTDLGLLDPNVTNGIYFTSLYAEYGLTEKLTGIVYFPFYARALFNNTVSGTTGEVITPGEAINGVGDLDLSLKYNLLNQGSFALSGILQLGIPLGNSAGGDAGALQTGDGEFNQMLQIEAGHGLQLGGLQGWTKAYAGFNNRTEGFSDEFRFGLEVGASLLDSKLLLIGRLYGIESFNNGTLPGDNASGTSIFANNSEHLTIAPEIAYKFNEHFGVSAGIAQALSGRLIYANTAYNVGVFYQW